MNKTCLSRMLVRMAVRSPLICKSGAAGRLKVHSQLVGDDVGQSRFAQAGRAVEQNVVHGFAARVRGLDRDRQILFDFGLPMNSASRCGRSFSSKEESSSTGAAETRRSRLSPG